MINSWGGFTDKSAFVSGDGRLDLVTHDNNRRQEPAMTNTTPTDEPRPILCSADGFRGEYEVDTFDPLSPTATVISTTAHCWLCGHEVNIARDIEPNLEPGERLVIVNGYLYTEIAEEDVTNA